LKDKLKDADEMIQQLTIQNNKLIKQINQLKNGETHETNNETPNSNPDPLPDAIHLDDPKHPSTGE
ncbi:MAG: hypothetical protein CUN57_00355, partial [Phototrophicales bacterium]